MLEWSAPLNGPFFLYKFKTKSRTFALFAEILKKDQRNPCYLFQKILSYKAFKEGLKLAGEKIATDEAKRRETLNRSITIQVCFRNIKEIDISLLP